MLYVTRRGLAARCFGKVIFKVKHWSRDANLAAAYIKMGFDDSGRISKRWIALCYHGGFRAELDWQHTSSFLNDTVQSSITKASYISEFL